MKRIKALLFDVSPFLYMSYYGASYNSGSEQNSEDLTKLSRICNNILLGKIRACFEMYEGHPIIPIFCYDGLHSIAKKKEFVGEYKEGRTGLPKEVKTGMINIVKLFPGYHIKNNEEEADDLVATAKQELKDKYGEFVEFVIFSKDNDLLQLCDYRTDFYDPAKDKGIRGRCYLMEKFNNITNFKHIILHKVCFGDSSDNIEGVFKGRRRAQIVEEIKKSLRFSEFLQSPIFENNDVIQKAKELFHIIKLKKDVPYNKIVNKDMSILERDIILEDF